MPRPAGDFLARGPLSNRAVLLLEGRAELERGRPEVREAEVVDRVECRRPAGTTGCSALWIVALVRGPCLQVAADERDRPVALPADLADPVAEADFPKLHVRRVLER